LPTSPWDQHGRKLAAALSRRHVPTGPALGDEEQRTCAVALEEQIRVRGDRLWERYGVGKRMLFLA